MLVGSLDNIIIIRFYCTKFKLIHFLEILQENDGECNTTYSQFYDISCNLKAYIHYYFV